MMDFSTTAKAHFENALRLLPFKDKVAIVGSYALWEWQCGQCSKVHDGGDNTVGWFPGDVDVFVTGETQASFNEIVDQYLDATQQAGIPLKVESRRAAIIDLVVDQADHSQQDHLASSPGKPVAKRKLPAISFVRHRMADCIADVPASFDIDICRVVLRINANGVRSFDIAEDVCAAIKSQTLTVFRDIGLQTAGSIKCRARVAKYESRGFGVNQGCVSSPTTLAAPFTYFTEAEEQLLGVQTGNDVGAVVPPLEPFVFCQVSGLWQAQVESTRVSNLSSHAAAGKQQSLSVVSYNIWGDPTARETRANSLIDLLLSERSDVICLQEVTEAVLTQLGEDARIRQLYLISDDPRTKNGMDIGSAQPSTAFRSRASTSLGFANVTLIRLGLAVDAVMFHSIFLPSEMGRHVLIATLKMGGDHQMIIANVHLDSNPERVDLRIEQLGRIQDALDALDGVIEVGGLQIVCGDFNFAPQGEEEKAVPTGWGDAWQELDSCGEGNTTHFGRIDRIFVNPKQILSTSHTKRLGVGITVDKARAIPISDHYGLRVDLQG